MRNIAIAVMIAFAFLFLAGCTIPQLRKEWQENFSMDYLTKGNISLNTTIPDINYTPQGIGNKTLKYQNMFCYDVGLAGEPDLAYCDSKPKDQWCALPNYESCLISCYLCVALYENNPKVCDSLNTTLASNDVAICYDAYREELTNPRSPYTADTGENILYG